MRRFLIIIAFFLAAVLGLTACDDNTNTGKGQKADSNTQQANNDRLVAKDPAHTMDVSPTRKTINRWIDTWGKDPNKLSYVYLQNANGDLLGYYVFKGLPVSMCTSISPNYKVVVPEVEGTNSGAITVPAPGMDAVYYSGGECNTYYGFDATSGAYMQYTAGLGINTLIYDQPLTNKPNVANLAPPRK